MTHLDLSQLLQRCAAFGDAAATLAANGLAQSTLVILAGLAAARLLRRRGVAVQSAVLRAALVAVAACPLASWALGVLRVPGTRIALPSAFVRTDVIPIAPGASDATVADRSGGSSTVPSQDDDGRRGMRSFADEPNAFGASPARDPHATRPEWGDGPGNGHASPAGPSAPETSTKTTTPSPFPRIHQTVTTLGTTGVLYLGWAGLWLIASGLLVAQFVLADRILRAARRAARPAGADVVAQCEAAARALGVPAPPVLVTPRVGSPCLVGWRDPAVLLPSDAGPVGRSVFIHELAHLLRGDCLWHLAGRAAAALFWFQPLLWLLVRRLEQAADEVCDDHAVTLGGDEPADYARALVDIAERLRPCWPSAYAAVGAMQFKSELGRRVLRIMDTSRSLSTRIGRRAAALVLVLAAATTLAAGLLGAAGGEGQDAPVKQQPEATKPPGRPAPSGPATVPADGDIVHVRGRVLDPNGRPTAGAAVAVVANWIQESPLAEARSGADGAFEVSFRKSLFSDRSQSWESAIVVAAAPGFGPDWDRCGHADAAGGEVLLRLVPDDVPIEGRILDLQGRPVKGARVKVGGVSAEAKDPSAPNFDPRDLGYPGELHKPWLDGSAPGLPAPVTTDADGRFRIVGLGRDRTASLRVSGPGISLTHAEVVTRADPPQTRNTGSYLQVAETVYGARFDLVVEAERIVAGTVRDAATGRPLAGVTVQPPERPNLKAITDGQGRYRIEGMRKGKGQVVTALPGDDQPYFMRDADVPDGVGLAPVTADFELHRGTWINGRVADRTTGRPVGGAIIRYLPYLTNDAVRKLPEFQRNRHIPGPDNRYTSKADGTYRLVAAAGPAVVTAGSANRPYRHGVGADQIKCPLLPDGRSFATYQPVATKAFAAALKDVDIPDGRREDVPLDFELDPGLTIHLTTVDPDGKPLTGVATYGHAPGLPIEVQRAATFDAVAFDPDERREIWLWYMPRKLGKFVTLTPADARGGAATVRLEPLATVTGRLLDPDGLPIPDAWVHATSDGPQAPTDAQGRFRLLLVPGRRYPLTGTKGFDQFFTDATDVAVAPGETRDLGDVRPRRDADAAAQVPTQPATKPATQSATQPATQPVQSATQRVQPAGAANADPAGETVHVRGVVLDRAGKPFTGARVIAAANWPYDDRAVPRGPLAEVRSGAGGRFEIAYRTSALGGAILANGQTAADVWKRAVVVASADGYGLGWQRWDRANPAGDVVLKLAEDLPVEGRVLGLEGRGVPGVKVTVGFAGEYIDLDVGDRGKVPPEVRENTLYGPLTAAGVPEAVTDAEGRFRVTGLGRERSSMLSFQSDRVVLQPVRFVTRAMDPITRTYGSGSGHETTQTYFGASIEVTAAPARSITGIVRDAKTNRPLAGATVEGNPGWQWGHARTTTDGQGRYRLAGLKKGRNDLLVTSGADEPYLAAEVEVPDQPGLDAIEANVSLYRGVWITGKVTDKATGNPVPATVQYTPLLSNRYAADVPAYQELRKIIRLQIPAGFGTTRPDGIFRVVGLPGRGLVAVRAASGDYLKGVGTDEIKERGGIGNPRAFATFVEVLPEVMDAAREFDVPEGATAATVDVQLDPGETIRVSVEDPMGRPASGFYAHGRQPRGIATRIQDATFDAVAFARDDRRMLAIMDETQKLGKIVVVSPKDLPDRRLTVRLEPMALVTGRALSADGHPVRGAHFRADALIPDLRRSVDRVGSALADGDGRFKLYVPVGDGVRVAILGSPDPYQADIRVRDRLMPEPGATIDLGDVRLVREKTE